MIQRRIDRYSTQQNAKEVYAYMAARLHDIMVLFHIPGFHHEKFRTEFKALTKLGRKKLHSELHQLCERYDKSNQEQFGKFKARLRRYLFTRHGQKALIVSASVRDQLEAMVREEGLVDVNEAVEQLLFLRKQLDHITKAKQLITTSDNEDCMPYRDAETLKVLFGDNDGKEG